MAYVDSGASISIFSIHEASRLGVDYTNGEKLMVTVGDGSSIPVYLHIMPIKISHISFEATIGFSPLLGYWIQPHWTKRYFRAIRCNLQ